METQEYFSNMADQTKLFTRLWLPDNDKCKATLLIVHGMGEHSGRYERFARFLTEHKIVVMGYDHRGHGQTAPSPDQKGVVESRDAFHQMAQDIGVMRKSLRKKYPEAPHFIFAHSMGSFLTLRHLQQDHGIPPAGVIYSGSSGAVSPLLPFGILLSAAMKSVLGFNHRSELLRNLVFKPYNDSFKPTRTRHDWISSDPDEVDRYVADAHCGFTPSASFLNHFFKGLRKTQKHQPFSGPHTYPVLLVAGAEDPISSKTDGINRLQQKLSHSGIDEVQTNVYKNGRHEMLSERNREGVMADIITWIDQVVADVQKK